MNRRRAFSLLELSVVMAIVSVLLSFGINIGTDALKGSDRTVTKERLMTVQKALDAYAKTNGHLPCPFARNLTPASASYGVEGRTGYTACANDGSNYLGLAGGIYFGAVPVRTLGLPDNYAGDAWNNKFYYAVSASHVGNAASYAITDGPITIRYGDLTTYYAITTDRTGAAGAGAVYVVLSHGATGKGAFPVNGASMATPCSGSEIDVKNCSGDGTGVFYDTAYNDGTQASTFFDDYIVWASNALDRIPTVAASGSCPVNCEGWCAPCTAAPTSSPSIICSHVIVSTSPCQAYCVYAYTSTNQFCP